MKVLIDKSFDKDIRKTIPKKILITLAVTIEEVQLARKLNDLKNCKKLKDNKNAYRLCV